jgi:hypothetical protein
MKDFDILGYVCSGKCWGLEPRRRRDGTYDETAETVMELLLSRMYWGLRERGRSSDEARAELNARIMALADEPEDPYGHIDFEIAFSTPEMREAARQETGPRPCFAPPEGDEESEAPAGAPRH